MYEEFSYQMKLDTCTSIGKLTTMILGIDPIKYVRYIPRGVFEKCVNLTAVEFSDECQFEEIGQFAFMDSKIETITLTNSLL